MFEPSPTSRARIRIGTPPGLDWRHPLTITPEGLKWVGHLIAWHEMREVRLVGGVLYVRPIDGGWISIGPFTGARLETLHQACELFARNRYRDDLVPDVSPADVSPEFVSPDVTVRGGPQGKVMGWPNRIIIAGFAVAAAIQSPERVIAIIAVVVGAVAILDGLRRWLACPELTVGTERVRWKGHEFGWSAIAEVGLVRTTLRVQPRSGDAVEVGPFSDVQAARIREGLQVFGGDRYRGEPVDLKK